MNLIEAFKAPTLSQRDNRWRYVKIGNQTKETLGGVGCLTTAKTMLCGGDDVAQMNKILIQLGHYGTGRYGAYAVTFDVQKINPHIRLIRASPRYERVLAPASLVEEYAKHVAQGNPAIVEVNFYKRFRPGAASALLSLAPSPALSERGTGPIVLEQALEREQKSLMANFAVAVTSRFRFSQHFVLSVGPNTIHDPWPLPGDVRYPLLGPLSPDYGPNLAIAIVRVIFYAVE